MRTAKKIIVIIMCLAVGGISSFIGARELIHSKQLVSRGKTAMGPVLDSEERIGRRSRTYYLTVAFKPDDGAELTSKVKVSSGVFDHFHIGSTVKVWYLAENPAICAAGDQVEMRYGSLISGIILLGAGIFLIVVFRRPADVEELAERVEGRLKNLTVTRYEYGPANPDDFKHLDLSFYNDGQRYLESLGYTFVADEENLTVRKSGTRALLRRLLSPDRATIATLYHFKSEKFPGKEAKVLDLETWLSNGNFVCTSNATSAGKFDSPPQIDSYFFSTPAPLDAVVQAHQHRLATALGANPGVQVVALNGMEDVRRAGDELQRIKAEFRSRAGISKAELERITGKSNPQIDELHATLAERRANQPPGEK
jgi:hypothetical protein